MGRILTVNSLRKKRIYFRLGCIGCMCKNGGEDALKCSTQGRANNGRKGLRDGVGGSVGEGPSLLPNFAS